MHRSIMNLGIAISFVLLSTAFGKTLHYHANGNCAVSSDAERFDCFPDQNPTQEACIQRGCCWQPAVTNQVGVPLCFFPSDFPNYQVTKKVVNGSVATVSLYNPATIFRPNMIHNLTCEVYSYTGGITRVRIYDATKPRYEVPIPLSFGSEEVSRTKISLEDSVSDDGRIVIKSSTGRTLFATPPSAPLIFTDQFIQVTTQILGLSVYGIGEAVASFQKNFSTWQRYALFSRDAAPSPDTNLYGVFPFALILSENGLASGLFFLNSNAMEVDITPYPSLTFRTIGGIIDLFMFEGPSPAKVIQQYHTIIPRPLLPPYWALGFHLCRWGYQNDTELYNIILRTITGGFPYDVQWVDIDHMNKFLDWTVDPVNFRNLPTIINYLHSFDRRFINIIDPAISNQQAAGTYAPYDYGHKLDVFIKAANGQELVGKVWPGLTVFPDFTHPNAVDYFYSQAAQFRKLVQFDGLWLDMNEPSNFYDGSEVGCPQNSLDNPPYVPSIAGKKLYASTICASAKQNLSAHYNIHSLYGYYETKVARQALDKLFGNQRSFILSRSTFVGSQQFTAHWTGDVSSSWTDLAYSIVQILNFNMYGIPFTGADVCGFNGDTTEELCVRWMQLGAFYPFMRNHNTIGARDQDPGAFSVSAKNYIRAALYSRYQFLPYLYTLLYSAAFVDLATVARPLFVAFPDDSSTYPIADQFLLGDALMVSPVTQQGAVSRRVYFPDATWYSSTGQATGYRRTWATVPAPLSTIPLHIRGGFIVPCQHPATTTTQSRKNSFYLLVALEPASQSAYGLLYMDDGLTNNHQTTDEYNLISFIATPGVLFTYVKYFGYRPTVDSTTLSLINIFGLANEPSQVLLNGTPVQFKYQDQVLTIDNLAVDLVQQAMRITWK